MADLKYNYQKNETPEERLRNKLQPFYFLIAEAAKITELYDVAKMCDANIEDIDALLDDITPFYTGLIQPVKGWDVHTIEKHLADADGTGREVWTNQEEGVVFRIDPEEYDSYTVTRSIHSPGSIFILTDIAYEGKFVGEPAVEVFTCDEEAHERFEDETYFWDNHEWIWKLGIDLIKGDYTTEQVVDFMQFVERHGYNVAECINEFRNMFKQSIKLNFWNG